jgi:hypothetical protein
MSAELDEGIGEATRISSLAPPGLRKPQLQVVSMLVIFASIFAFGVLSWISFARSVGGPVGLFTQTDYVAISIATRMVSSGDGARLYNLGDQLQEQQTLRAEGYLSLSPSENSQLKYPYPYTPFIAVLWSPLAGMSPLSSMALWDLLNLAAFVFGFWLLLDALQMQRITRLMLLLGSITSFPMIQNLEQGQSSGIVMLGFGAGVALLKRGRDLPAGLAFGLLLVKIQWLPIIVVVLLVKRRWWSLLGICAAGAATLAVSIGVLGTSWISDYLVIVQKAESWSRDLLLDPWYGHGLSGGLTALLGRGTDELVRNLNNLATVAIAVFLLYLWRGKWQPATTGWDGAMAVTTLAVIFTNPQLNTHDLSLLAIPAALGISCIQGWNSARTGKPEWVNIAWYGLLWIAYLAPALFLPQIFTLPLRITSIVIMLMLALLSYVVLRDNPTRLRSAL